MDKRQIRLAIVGVGNCASALVQGLVWHRNRPTDEPSYLMTPDLAGCTVDQLRVVAAFDVDRRKVGRPLEEAIFAEPNCTTVFQREVPPTGVTVQMAPVLDGVAAHMADYPDGAAFRVADLPPVDVAAALREASVDVVVCFLPVGSELAARHLAEACLEAGAALVNCVPVLLASDPEIAERFRAAGVPMIGDDIKSQFGATMLHRILARSLGHRGARVVRSYQLNTGGNTDFLNMLDRSRLATKRLTKTESVQSQLEVRLPDDQLHVGPSDYVPWQNDNKIAFVRVEWEGFCGTPMHLDVRMSVEDSPNSAGVVIDAVRCAKAALDAGIGGPIDAACSWYMKHPPKQLTDDEARLQLQAFLAEISEIGEIGGPKSRADRRIA